VRHHAKYLVRPDLLDFGLPLPDNGLIGVTGLPRWKSSRSRGDTMAGRAINDEEEDEDFKPDPPAPVTVAALGIVKVPNGTLFDLGIDVFLLLLLRLPL